MKKLILLLFVYLSGCSGPATLEGYVMKKDNHRILVVNGSEDHDNAIWLSNAFNKVDIGQYVHLWIDGPIAESFPAQGSAAKVEVIKVEKPKGATFTQEEALRQLLASKQVNQQDVIGVKHIEYDHAEDVWRITLKPMVSASGNDQEFVFEWKDD
ncbi:YobA family protein [Metabacillus iocasae]|uniref:DUF3221 domain-containing protein n=1 Tax=Priestia iocasae TaxID=2291674 RepID=A0ABS2QVP3_9BACI|nr:YobA family protein [Metabacillus iocasae]MBM7703556.1 hypothetical protein [Metabacillus iocasae]